MQTEPIIATQISPHTEFRNGLLAAAPLWLGAAPFGVIYAVSALAAGLTPMQTLAMSLFVFAGAAQFTAVGMFAAAAAPLAIVLTTLIVNARHVLLTASLLPHLRDIGLGRRFLLAAQLTDESYALGMARFLERRGSAAFTFGANLSIYVVWQASTLIGILIGRMIPDPTVYGLDLVFPLTFIGLLTPLLRQAANRATALVALALTIGGALWLPGSWYILLAGTAPLVLLWRRGDTVTIAN
jgi:4-azaleucine resistance transporter AzlC